MLEYRVAMRNVISSSRPGDFSPEEEKILDCFMRDLEDIPTKKALVDHLRFCCANIIPTVFNISYVDSLLKLQKLRPLLAEYDTDASEERLINLGLRACLDITPEYK